MDSVINKNFIGINFTSKRSLLLTVKNNKTVFYWVSLLIFNEKIRTGLSINKDASKLYNSLIQNIRFRIYTIVFLVLFSVFFFFYYTVFLYGAVLPCLIFLFLRKQGRDLTFAITNIFIDDSFKKNDLIKKTLLQISDYYHQNFQTPCLLDIHYKSRAIHIATLTLIFIFFGFVYPSNALTILLIFIASYSLIVIYYETFALWAYISNQDKKQNNKQYNKQNNIP